MNSIRPQPAAKPGVEITGAFEPLKVKTVSTEAAATALWHGGDSHRAGQLANAETG